MSIDNLKKNDIVLITKDLGEVTPTWKTVAKIPEGVEESAKEKLFEDYKSFKKREDVKVKILKVIQ